MSFETDLICSGIVKGRFKLRVEGATTHGVIADARMAGNLQEAGAESLLAVFIP